jgi:hypothetical protein
MKADIQAWLTKHNILFDKKLLRPALLALAKANKPEPHYIIDDIAKEKGHIILRLPPYRSITMSFRVYSSSTLMTCLQ